MSPEPPDVPSGDMPSGDEPGGDPFKGVPIFGDLARMFQQQGPVGWDAARQLARSVATDGGQEANVDPMERIKIEQLARVAELQVGTVTGLPASTSGTGIAIAPVTRGQWADATLDAWRPLFESLADALDDEPSTPSGQPDPSDPLGFMAPLLQMIGPMMLGMTAGSMVGHLARRSFGQYDLPIPRPPSDQLMVIPANLDEFGAEWSIPADDLRLWICLQEVAVHTVLRVPHVRARLDDLLTRYVSSFEPDTGALEERFGSIELGDPSSMAGLQSLFGDPQVLLGAMQSPAQRDLLPGFEAIVAAIVGYVDRVVDLAGQRLLQNHGMLAEAARRRRVEADPSDRFVERLFGLELTQAAYDRGNAFVAGVVERAGDDGLARLWESERTLPTPAELDAPGLWLARIELPED
ncbi:MAG TPA: zinc-dependent metalloprotease [Acidimicrobiales bacterium]